MKNPFVYSSTAEGESFCNREAELSDLSDSCLNGQNVYIYAHRRLGKTSLIKVLLKQLSKSQPEIKTFYIDLYGTLDEKDFIATVFSSFAHVETKLERLANAMKILFTSVRPKLSYNPDNNNIEIEASYDPNEKSLVFDQVVESLSRYSEKSKTIVVFDEFQEMSGYGDKTIEKRLRKIIQFHDNVAYMFLGSQRRMLEQMFTESNRALYNLAMPYPLSRIDSGHYRTWIKGLFRKYGKAAPADNLIDSIIATCENHPLFVQQFFYFLWKEPEITPPVIQRVEETILERRFHEYANIWDKLTPNQKKSCILLCKFGGESIYQVKNLQDVGLKGSSQLKKAMEYLIDNEIVYRNGTYRFSDVMFNKWLNRFVVK